MQKATFCFRGMDNFRIEPAISEITPNRDAPPTRQNLRVLTQSRLSRRGEGRTLFLA